jgi:4,5-dihydroxyphthalate decarboxylase
VLELSLACQNIDRSRAILDGRVAIDGVRLTLIPGSPEEIFQRAFRHQEFDIAELSLSTHLLTVARGESKYIAIPAFLSRAFRHSAIYIRADAGIDSPQALKQKRIGVPDFQQTAGVWVRGLLADEYGVTRGDVHWHMGGLEQPGRSARMPLNLQNGIRIDAIGPQQTLAKMLAAGELDAVIAPRAPSTMNGNGQIRRLFADYRQVEEDYYRKTKLFPLMHVIGIRRSLVEKHPWLPVNVFAAFSRAKKLAIDELARLDTMTVTHPWIAEEMGRVRALMGEDIWPYGIERNRNELTTLIRYAEADGLIKGPLALEDLFAETTFDQFNF